MVVFQSFTPVLQRSVLPQWLVLEHGYSDTKDSFVRSFETDERLDTATLLLPIVGFLPSHDPRVQTTIDRILDQLVTTDGLVVRYQGDDGLPGNDGAFVACSFWLINALAHSERTEEATTLFQNACEYVSPLGLLAEEIDPDTGEQRGNFPQAFSQIGSITSVIGLENTDADRNPGLDTSLPDVTTEGADHNDVPRMPH